jgi:DNA mismatch endonuclease (patch repair protein)
VKEEYTRDKRSPKPKTEAVSRVMSANKAKNTTPEILFRKALWKAGLKGYRNNYKTIPGRPDIVFPKHKLAIFVHGCFWHRCPYCDLPLPKSNTAFWTEKFTKNQERDQRKKKDLEALEWKVIEVWECQLKNEISKSLNTIKKEIRK